MAKQGPIDTIAQRMKGELESDVAKLVPRLSGELQGAGMTEQEKGVYLATCYRQWPNPLFRTNPHFREFPEDTPEGKPGLLQRVGAQNFLATAREMVARFGQPPLETPPVALSPAGAVPAGVAQGGPTGVGLPPAGSEPASLPQPIPSPVTGATSPESPAVQARFGVAG